MCDPEGFPIHLDGHKNVEPETLTAEELLRFVGCASARACAFTPLALEQAAAARQLDDGADDARAYEDAAFTFQAVIGQIQIHRTIEHTKARHNQ